MKDSAHVLSKEQKAIKGYYTYRENDGYIEHHTTNFKWLSEFEKLQGLREDFSNIKVDENYVANYVWEAIKNISRKSWWICYDKIIT